MMNGEGLRVVLWLSGCSHKCKGCQNLQTWNADSGIPFDESAKEELLKELDKDYISGLTLTGGDPLHEANLDSVLDLVNRIRLSIPQKTIWLYTGYEWEYIFDSGCHYHSYTLEELSIGRQIRQQITSQCDVVIDGRYIESQRDITLPWRGSSNQRVIDVKKSIKENKIILFCE